MVSKRKEKVWDVSEVRPRKELLEGERVSTVEVLNMPLIIEDFVELPSKFHDGEFMLVQARLEDGRRVVFACGSAAVMDVLRLAKKEGKMPLAGKIVKRKRYYELVGRDE